jgi:hypothetical protein
LEEINRHVLTRGIGLSALGKLDISHHEGAGEESHTTKEREEKKISSTRMRSKSMSGESAIAAKGRDDSQSSIVTLLQLYDIIM